MLMGLSACSSGTGTPSTGSSGSCDSMCNRMAGLNCSNFNATECVTDCQQDSGFEVQACPNEVSSYIGCLQNLPMECDADGDPTLVGDESAIFNQCGTQALAYGACTACLPDSGDSTCETCEKQNCCNERKALFTDPAVLSLYQCYEACADLTCRESCNSQYPGFTAKAEALEACEQLKCSNC